jgi:hypothetical protein
VRVRPFATPAMVCSCKIAAARASSGTYDVVCVTTYKSQGTSGIRAPRNVSLQRALEQQGRRWPNDCQSDGDAKIRQRTNINRSDLVFWGQRLNHTGDRLQHLALLGILNCSRKGTAKSLGNDANSLEFPSNLNAILQRRRCEAPKQLYSRRTDHGERLQRGGIVSALKGPRRRMRLSS